MNRSNKQGMAMLNGVWCSMIIPAFTLWGTVEFAKVLVQHKLAFFSSLAHPSTWLSSSAATTSAMACSSFSFSGAMFICAANTFIGMQKASKKCNLVYLLEDRIKKYQALKKNKDHSKHDQVDRILYQIAALQSKTTRFS